METLSNYVREVVVNYRGAKRKSPTFTTAASVVEFLRDSLPDNSREHFLALYLNQANQAIGFSVTTGSLSQCSISPLEIFQKALLLGSNQLIVAHNHPSGETKPSREDIAVTERLKEGGKLLTINILDHIILGEGKFLSLMEEGLV